MREHHSVNQLQSLDLDIHIFTIYYKWPAFCMINIKIMQDTDIFPQPSEQEKKEIQKQLKEIDTRYIPVRLTFGLSEILPLTEVQFPIQILHVLNQIVLKNVPDNIAFPGNIIQEGFSGKFDCEIGDCPARIDLQFKEKTLKMLCEIGQIQLTNILTLKTSNYQRMGPTFEVQVDSFNSNFNMEGLISILDLFDRPVYGKADVDGIIFKTQGPIKIFGLDFIEDSFELEAGLLRLSDQIKVNVDLKIESLIPLIEKVLTETATKMAKPFQEAQDQLNELNKKIAEKKNLVNIAFEKKQNKFFYQKIEYRKHFEPLKKIAQTVFDNELKEVKQKFTKEGYRLFESKQRAQENAKKAYEDELKRAVQKHQVQKNKTAKQLQAQKQQISKNLHLLKSEIQLLQTTIISFREREINTVSIQNSLNAAKSKLPGMEASSKEKLYAAEQKYKNSIAAADQLYFSAIKGSKTALDSMMALTDNIYNSGLQTNKAEQNEARKAAQHRFASAIAEAKLQANEKSDALSAQIDQDYYLANQNYNLTDLEIIIAKQSLVWAEEAARPALEYLSALPNGISSIIKCKKVNFKFDIKKDRATITIQLTILGKSIKHEIIISFKQVSDFVLLFANKVWDFIKRQY